MRDGFADIPDEYRSIAIHNLGEALRLRFLHLGERADINAAIVHLGHAVEVGAHPYVGQAMFLSLLSAALRARFESDRADRADLTAAIAAGLVAVEADPGGNREAGTLGAAFLARAQAPPATRCGPTPCSGSAWPCARGSIAIATPTTWTPPSRPPATRSRPCPMATPTGPGSSASSATRSRNDST